MKLSMLASVILVILSSFGCKKKQTESSATVNIQSSQSSEGTSEFYTSAMNPDDFANPISNKVADIYDLRPQQKLGLTDEEKEKGQIALIAVLGGLSGIGAIFLGGSALKHSLSAKKTPPLGKTESPLGKTESPLADAPVKDVSALPSHQPLFKKKEVLIERTHTGPLAKTEPPVAAGAIAKTEPPPTLKSVGKTSNTPKATETIVLGNSTVDLIPINKLDEIPLIEEKIPLVIVGKIDDNEIKTLALPQENGIVKSGPAEIKIADQPVPAIAHVDPNGLVAIEVKPAFKNADEAVRAADTIVFGKEPNLKLAREHLAEAIRLDAKNADAQFKFAKLSLGNGDRSTYYSAMKAASDLGHKEAQTSMVRFLYEGRPEIALNPAAGKTLAEDILQSGETLEKKEALITYLASKDQAVLSKWLSDSKSSPNYKPMREACAEQGHDLARFDIAFEKVDTSPRKIDATSKDLQVLYFELKQNEAAHPELKQAFDDLAAKEPKLVENFRTSFLREQVKTPLSNNLRSTRVTDLSRFPSGDDLHASTQALLKESRLKPTSAYQIHGRTFYFSDIVRAGDGERDVLVMYTLNRSGKTVPRFFYKSISDGGWRSCPSIGFGGHLSKGDFHYTQETKPHPDILKHLDTIGDEGRVIKDNDLPSEIIDSFAAWHLPRDVYTFDVAVKHDRPDSMSEFVKCHPGKCLSNDPAALGKSSWSQYYKDLNYPDNFLPKFENGAESTYKLKHTILGETDVYVFKSELNGEPIEWHMASAPGGKMWVDRISYESARVNAYGISDRIFDMGGLTQKPVEYRSQASYLEVSEVAVLPPQFGNYVDITPLLRNMKPIQDFEKYLKVDLAGNGPSIARQLDITVTKDAYKLSPKSYSDKLRVKSGSTRTFSPEFLQLMEAAKNEKRGFELDTNNDSIVVTMLQDYAKTAEIKVPFIKVPNFSKEDAIPIKGYTWTESSKSYVLDTTP